MGRRESLGVLELSLSQMPVNTLRTPNKWLSWTRGGQPKLKLCREPRWDVRNDAVALSSHLATLSCGNRGRPARTSSTPPRSLPDKPSLFTGPTPQTRPTAGFRRPGPAMRAPTGKRDSVQAGLLNRRRYWHYAPSGICTWHVRLILRSCLGPLPLVLFPPTPHAPPPSAPLLHPACNAHDLPSETSVEHD